MKSLAVVKQRVDVDRISDRLSDQGHHRPFSRQLLGRVRLREGRIARAGGTRSLLPNASHDPDDARTSAVFLSSSYFAAAGTGRKALPMRYETVAAGNRNSCSSHDPAAAPHPGAGMPLQIYPGAALALPIGQAHIADGTAVPGLPPLLPPCHPVNVKEARNIALLRCSRCWSTGCSVMNDHGAAVTSQARRA